jgi:hypothetical protein
VGGDRRMASVSKGDGADKGVILSRRTVLADKKKQEEDDPFGGGDNDPFGDDVFAVEVEEPKEEEESGKGAGAAESDDKKLETPVQEKLPEPEKDNEKEQAVPKDAVKVAPVPAESREPQRNQTKDNVGNHNRHDPSSLSSRSTSDSHDLGGGRRATNRHRGPPVGFAMDPAAGGPHGGIETEIHSNGRGAHGASEDSQRDRSYRGRGQSDRGGRYRTGGYGGRQGGRGDQDRSPRGNGREEDEYTSNDRSSLADGPTHDNVSACFRL